jgi:uncharacterized membrane protein
MVFAESVDLTEFWIMFFRTFFPQGPFLLACLVGLILAVIRWRRHPRVSLFATIGCGLLLASSLIGSIAIAWVQHQMITASLNDAAALFGLIGIARGLVGTVGFVFLLLAVFCGRDVSRFALPENSEVFSNPERYTGSAIREGKS